MIAYLSPQGRGRSRSAAQASGEGSFRETHRHGRVGNRVRAALPAGVVLVVGVFDVAPGAGASDQIVRAYPAGELFDDLDRVLSRDVDDPIRSQLLSDREPRVARAGQD